MRYIKTFEQYSSNEPIVNEEIIGTIAKAINKLGSSNLDLNTDDAKITTMAAKENMEYKDGKITKSARWEIIKGWRKQLTEGGIPAELVDKAIVMYSNSNGWAAPFTFDQKAQKGNIMTYNAEKKILNIRSGSTSTGAAGITGAKM